MSSIRLEWTDDHEIELCVSDQSGSRFRTYPSVTAALKVAREILETQRQGLKESGDVYNLLKGQSLL